jgi:iron complex outermembrane receptor protein
VTDGEGNALPGVVVEIASPTFPRTLTAMTDGDGRFAIANVAAGTHLITYTLSGFRKLSREVSVAGEQTTAGATLALAVGDAITVIATAPPAGRTATKVDTPLLDIPQSIQVVPEALLEEQNATRVIEAITNVSGVVQGPGYGRTSDSFNVRGFSAGGIYKNGTPVRVFTGIEDISNVERLEVLKGPAGVLYGQGAPGGFVNVVTKRPARTAAYSLMLRSGSDSYRDGSVDLTGPVGSSDRVLYRFIASREDSGSFRDFIETRRLFFTPSLTWLADAKTTLTVFGEWIDQDRPYDVGFPVMSGRVVPLPRDRNLGEPWEKIHYEVRTGGFYLDRTLSSRWALRSTFRYQDSFEDDLLVTIAPQSDNRTVRRTAGELTQGSTTADLTADLLGHATTGSVHHRLLLGVDVRQQSTPFSFRSVATTPLDIFAPEHGAPPPSYTAAPSVFPAESETAAIYLQDQIDVATRWKVLGGIRFDRVTNEISEVTDNAFSPRLGVVFQPRTDVSLYASYSTSFVPNTARAAGNRPLDPQEAAQYEIGVKNEWMQGRLTSTLAIYDLTRANIPTPDPANPTFSVLVGEQRSRGAELDVAGRISRGLTLTASYAYTDAEVTRDNTIATGNRLPNTPLHSGRIWTNYRFDDGMLAGFGFGAGVLHQGRRAGDARNTFALEAFTRADAAVSYEAESWGVSVNCKNIFDAEYLEAAIANSALPAAPRSVLASVSLRY